MKLGDKIQESEFPRVTNNGLHKTEEARKKNSIFDHQALEKQLEALLESQTRERTERDFVLWTSRAGAEQFQEAVREESLRQVGISASRQGSIQTNEGPAEYTWEIQGMPIITGTPGETPEGSFEDLYIAGIDPISDNSSGDVHVNYQQLTPEVMHPYTPLTQQELERIIEDAATDVWVDSSTVESTVSRSYFEIQNAALQSGAIDMLTFLDNISNHDV